jgi:peptidylprolyl isomerase
MKKTFVLLGVAVLLVGVGAALSGCGGSGASSAASGVKAGDTVKVDYTGKLEDGTVFDSSTDEQFGHVQPLEFTVGAGQMIPGFDKGVVGMKVGEEKTITIPPEEGYGDQQQGPIPPNSTLIFDVKLVEIVGSN